LSSIKWYGLNGVVLDILGTRVTASANAVEASASQTLQKPGQYIFNLV